MILATLPDSPRQSLVAVPIRLHRATTPSFLRTTRRVETPNYMNPMSQNFQANRQRELLRQQSFDMKANTHSENQQFLKDIVANILDGQGIGWLKTNRVKKLMEDENYRNFVLSRLNINLDKRYADEDDHIDDVVRQKYDFSNQTLTHLR